MLFVLAPLFLAPLGVILSRCAQEPSLFALHPAANAFAFLFCMPAALYAMTERKATTDHAKRVTLVKLHAAFQTLALVLLCVAGAAAYATKEAYEKPHFTSTHSWIAGATSTMITLNMLGGVASTFAGKKNNWQWKNPGHRIGGTISFLLGGASVVYGLYSGSWGTSQLGESLQLTLAGLVVAAYALLLLKVVLTKPVSIAKKKD